MVINSPAKIINNTIQIHFIQAKSYNITFIDYIKYLLCPINFKCTTRMKKYLAEMVETVAISILPSPRVVCLLDISMERMPACT